MSTAAEIRQEAPALYDQFRRSQPGAIARLPRWWDVRFGMVRAPDAPKRPAAFFALHRSAAGAVDGYAQYRVHGEWDDRVSGGVVEIDELLAVSDDAYSALWRHCAGLDLVKKVTADNRPALEALPWLLADRRAVRQRGRADFLWVRLLDVPAALAARRYRVEDRLVLEVEDSWRGGAMRLALAAEASSATCGATDEPADLTVEVADLGAAYLGGMPLWPVAAAGRVIEHRAGAVAAFDRLFGADRPPWCNTWF
jgi:predicted acetyltransferase